VWLICKLQIPVLEICMEGCAVVKCYFSVRNWVTVSLWRLADLYCTYTTVIRSVNQQYKYDTTAKPQYHTNYKNITYLKGIYFLYFIFNFCCLFKDCFTTSEYLDSNNALGSMWKAFILAYFDVISLHLPEVTEENHENVRIFYARVRNRTEYVRNTSRRFKVLTYFIMNR